MAADTLPAFLAGAEGALLDRDRPVPYADLARESACVAQGLRELGVRAGDRVGLWLPNVPAWLAVLVACARLGAIAVALNTRFKSHELSDIVARSLCRVVVLWPGFKNIDFLGTLAQCPSAALEAVSALVAYTEEAAVPERIADKPVHRYQGLLERPPLEEDASRPDAGCILFTTSGTTKAPKFVLHDQRTVIGHARNVARNFGYAEPGAKILVSAPLCGVYGFCNAMAALAAGRPLIMYPSFDAVECANAVRRHGVTHANATDEMIAQMLAATPETPAFPSARFFGFAAFSPALVDLPARAQARGLKLVGLYGSSELQALLARQSEAAPLPERGVAGGHPVSEETRVRTRDPDTGSLLAHGAAGELEFMAPSRMVGYFGDAAATRAAVTDDGWFRSGDLGYTSPEGRFTFIARLGDALRLSGFLVSPAEIEEVLQQHADVVMAQVVGVETAAGVKAVAFVIAKPGFDEASVLAHCQARMARFKVPLRVRPLAEFPVTPGANATKIQKGKLRELARALLADPTKDKPA
jgi:fatty-acyl-CoA synthase